VTFILLPDDINHIVITTAFQIDEFQAISILLSLISYKI